MSSLSRFLPHLFLILSCVLLGKDTARGALKRDRGICLLYYTDEGVCDPNGDFASVLTRALLNCKKDAAEKRASSQFSRQSKLLTGRLNEEY